MAPLTTNDKFTFHGSDLDLSIIDFWSWAYSDLLSNTGRGVLAEFIVYSSLKFYPPPTSKMRTNWTPYDLTGPSGQRIEVKSAAYLQSWDNEYHKHISFDIAPKRAWDPVKGYSPQAKRNCDLYVFCLYKALSKDISPLDLDQWEFYILPTSILDEKIPTQKKIGLSSLLSLHPIVTDYAGLRDAIETIKGE